MDKTFFISIFRLVPRFFAQNGLYLLSSELIRRAGIIFRRWVLGAKLGCPDIAFGPRCYLRGLASMRIGKNFHAAEGLWLEAITTYAEQNFSPSIVIGNSVFISRWSHIAATCLVEIGDGVLIGSKVLITDHNHGAYQGPNQSDPTIPPAERKLGGGGPVVIEENVFIGDNVSILGPVRIGYGAVIAANSFVTSDVPPNMIVGGSPARPLKQFELSSMSWKRK